METSVLQNPPRTMMEVFTSLPEGTLVQLIQNKLIMSPAPKDKHQYIVGEIFAELRNFLKKNKLGVVRISPYDVYLNDSNAFQPDIIFVSNKNIGNIKKNGLHGTPDLVVEVLSPATANYDKNAKKKVYEACGVTEYWIIDPHDSSTICYFLTDKKYIEIFRGTDQLKSRLLNCLIEF